MLLSMTGYGRTTFSHNGKNVVIEIKTLNSKSLDLNLRLAPAFKECEMDIRNLVNKFITRGKTDCSVGYEMSDDKNGDINTTAVKEYYAQIKKIAAELGVEGTNLFELVFRLPNVTTTSSEALTEAQANGFKAKFTEACVQLEKFRRDEGLNLEKDITLQIKRILNALEAVELINPVRVEQQRLKMFTDIKTYSTSQEIDMNRFEQELIFYIERMDITEEITRLKSHCQYFNESMAEQVNEKGKKLGFITQEMNREINTIGSKAYHAEMQKQVVIMKDELEKIKEQLNNVL